MNGDNKVVEPQKVEEAVVVNPASDFVREYEALCNKTGFQIVVSPAWVRRDDGTFSLVLQPSVGKMPSEQTVQK